ncbi:MAG: hypothetical protein HIU57_06880, partial [Acidobacteria bacterium]|nr:hypothetical protein [Acidobacteriota bacterium]
MLKRRWAMGVLLTLTSGWALAPSVPAGSSTPVTNLNCARQVVSQWSLTRVARETVVVSAQASSLASLRAAAAQGYGGFLLFGASAPATLPRTLASLRGLEP